MSAHPDLRVALWLDDLRVSINVHDFAEWVASQPGIHLAALLLAAAPADAQPSGAVAGALHKAVVGFESVLLRRRGARYAATRERFDLGELAGRLAIPILPSAQAGLQSPLELDLIILLATEVPAAGVSIPSRFGTIAFEEADPCRRNGAPTGFWEVLERRDTTPFALTRFATDERKGEVLLRGHLPTRHFYLLNQAAVREKAFHYLRQLVVETATSRQATPALAELPASNEAAGAPGGSELVRYLCRSLAAIVGRRFKRMLGRDEVWHVAFLRSDWRGAPLWRATAIDNPPGRYLADPFVVQRDGGDYCFVEDLDRAQQRGSISVYKLGAKVAERLGIVIDETFHLSFPYLFEHDGALFMCPESSANKDIRIYRCVEFPMKWQLEEIAMSGVNAVDTMIFERSGKWWLFSNMDPGNTGEMSSELFIFSSDSPFGADWRPHPANPVLIDAARARNAGLLVDGEKTFRVSQRQGFARYGKGAQINEIVALTEETYVERCIATIDPSFGKGLLGTHHFHSRGGVTVFDFLAGGSATGAFAAHTR